MLSKGSIWRLAFKHWHWQIRHKHLFSEQREQHQSVVFSTFHCVSQDDWHWAMKHSSNSHFKSAACIRHHSFHNTSEYHVFVNPHCCIILVWVSEITCWTIWLDQPNVLQSFKECRLDLLDCFLTHYTGSDIHTWWGLEMRLQSKVISSTETTLTMYFLQACDTVIFCNCICNSILAHLLVPEPQNNWLPAWLSFTSHTVCLLQPKT